ncbi:MAG TPA: hypothetical protein VNF74_02085 [Terriglobales bacterium]|nr:hypothetical protein [Terriglobales bacterium]
MLLLVHVKYGPGTWLELLPPAAAGCCSWLVARLDGEGERHADR